MNPIAPANGGQRRRVLILANDPAGPADVERLLGDGRGERPEVLVVAPSLNSWSGRLVRGPAAAGRAAEARLAATVVALRSAGLRASVIVGDADPLLAMEDALSVFDAHEVVIATDAARADGWLGATLVERARAHTPVPVRHAAVTGASVPTALEPLAAA